MREEYNGIVAKVNKTNRDFMERMLREVGILKIFKTKEEQTEYCRGMYSNVNV